MAQPNCMALTLGKAEVTRARHARSLWAKAGLALALICLLLICGQARAEVYTRRSGSISQFRLLTADLAPGKDVHYKLSTRYAGTVLVTLKNERTGTQTTLKNDYYTSGKNLLITVPGSLFEENAQYTLSATLTYKKRQLGSAEAGFGYVKPVAKVTSLTAGASFSPLNGETLPIRFSLEQAAQVYAYALDSSGKTARALCEGAQYPAGAATLAWDGCDAGGALLPEGNYTVSVYCRNAAGNSPTLTASARLVGSAEGAIIGERARHIASALIPAGVFEGEDCTVKLNATAAGTFAVKLKDSTTGSSLKFSGGKASVGANGISIGGDRFVAGHSYIVQIQLSSGGKAIGAAQLRFTAGVRPPKVTAFDAPEAFRAGSGAYMEAHFTMATSGYADLRVLDAGGQTVATILNGAWFAPGARSAAWNGGDASGKLLASGSYTLSFSYRNAAGTSETRTKAFAYTAAQGLPAALTKGSVSRLMLLSDPELPERTDVRLRVETKVGGTLRILLVRLDNGVSTLVCNRSVSAGSTDITLDGSAFGAYTYTLDASLYSGGSRTGRARVSLRPRRVDPAISAMACQAAFGGTWGDTCEITLTTESSGALNVDVRDASGTVVKTLYSQKRASAGKKTFSWSGKLQNGSYATEGSYTVVAQYTDAYGVKSNLASAVTKLEKPVYPAGVYGYAYVGVGNYKTRIYLYTEPGGKQRVGYAYAQSSVFEILEDCGEYLYVQASLMAGEPQRGYVSASQIRRVAITSPYRIDVCISRSGEHAQTLFLYKDGALVDSFKVSTGTKVGSTPTGDYVIMDRLPRFYSGSSLCIDALRVVGGVCIHRVPLVNGSYRSTSAKLGSVASHGCIRVPVEKSDWLYKNIPNTTPVTIYTE